LPLGSRGSGKPEAHVHLRGAAHDGVRHVIVAVDGLHQQPGRAVEAVLAAGGVLGEVAGVVADPPTWAEVGEL
jgi:hypothetical protein